MSEIYDQIGTQDLDGTEYVPITPGGLTPIGSVDEIDHAIIFNYNPEKIISDRTGRYIAREVFTLAKFYDNMPQKAVNKWAVFFNSGSPDAVMSDRTGRILAHLLGAYFGGEEGPGLPENAAEFNPTKAISDRTGRLIVTALALHNTTETGGKDASHDPTVPMDG